PASPRAKRRAVALRAFWRGAVSRFASPLTRRIILLNLGGLFALLIGFLYLNQFREGLIDARIQSLQTQSEIIAAAVAASATVDTDAITIDPEKLLKLAPGESYNVTDGSQPALEFSLNPERIGPLLRRLVSPTRTRARIYDRDGELLLDSRSVSGRSNILRFDLPPGGASGQPQIGADAQTPYEEFVSTLRRWMRRPGLPLYEDIGTSNGKGYLEVADALTGNARWVVRANARARPSFRSRCRCSASARCAAPCCCRRWAATSTSSSPPNAGRSSASFWCPP